MATRQQRRREFPSVGDSLREYGRGLAGGFLFSLPLLYTMEVWWSGFLATPERLLALMCVTFALLVAYNRFSGMRRDSTWPEIVIDSVESSGLGIAVAAGSLFLFGRIGPDVPLPEAVSKIVVESTIVAIGFSVGAAQLGSRDDKDQGKTGDEESGRAKESDTQRFVQQSIVAVLGAVLFAANVGPTQEIVNIGIETPPTRLVGVVLLSILIAAFVLYFIDFTGADTLVNVDGKLDIVLGTIVTYAIAFAVSAAILWFFGRFDGLSLAAGVREITVLAFPGSLGASAGRLILQL